MKQAPGNLFLSCILFCCVGCDQATKQIAASMLDELPRTYFGGALRLKLSRNPGAFLSLGDGLPPALRTGIFCWGVAALLLGLLLYAFLARPIARAQMVGLCLCVAGGLSNLMDRVRLNGAVIDFLNVGVGPVRTGIFNVADMFILIGAAMLAISFLQRTARPTRHG